MQHGLPEGYQIGRARPEASTRVLHPGEPRPPCRDDPRRGADHREIGTGKPRLLRSERRRGHAQRHQQALAKGLGERRGAIRRANDVGQKVEGVRGVAVRGSGRDLQGMLTQTRDDVVPCRDGIRVQGTSTTPEVWLSRCQRRTSSPRPPCAETAGAKAGRRRAIGSVRAMRPSSTSCITAVATIGLVTDATQNRCSAVTRSPVTFAP